MTSLKDDDSDDDDRRLADELQDVSSHIIYMKPKNPNDKSLGDGLFSHMSTIADLD